MQTTRLWTKVNRAWQATTMAEDAGGQHPQREAEKTRNPIKIVLLSRKEEEVVKAVAEVMQNTKLLLAEIQIRKEISAV